MSLRTVVLICAVAGIPLALLVLALPITWGYGGYEFVPGTSYARVYFSDPSGPAYAAGLRVGQHVIANKGNEYVQEDAGPVGTVVREHVLEPNGTIRVIRFTFPAFTGALAVQQQIDKFVNALTALGAWQRRDYLDPSGGIKMTPATPYADLRDLPAAWRDRRR